MILFVFEGKKREPELFRTMEKLFFKDSQNIVCSFGNGAKSSDFSEIYLVFDYDFHNTNISADDMNSQLEEMLEMFDNETENGKLYINYPMVEAIRYTKKLPDSMFHKYTVSRQQCLNSSFKKIADEFSDYKSLDFLSLSDRRSATDSEMNSMLPKRTIFVPEIWQSLKLKMTYRRKRFSMPSCGNMCCQTTA